MIVVFCITSSYWIQIYTRCGAESSLLNCKPAQEHFYRCLDIPNIYMIMTFVSLYNDNGVTWTKKPQSNNNNEYHIVTNFNTALVVRRIKDDLIDTLDFRNKLEIPISDILILPVCFLNVKLKVNKNNQEKLGLVSLLICFQMDTQYKNLKYPISNTHLSQKDVGKYLIASNPYLELC